MQLSLRIFADYLSIDLLLGLCSIDDIIAWADKLIEEEERPPDWTIQLSTSENKHPLDIIRILDLVPGTKDLDFSLRMAIAKLGKVYSTISPERGRFVQPKDSKLLSLLYFFVQEYEELLALGNSYKKWIE